MRPSGAIEWLLCLSVAIVVAALLSPIVIDASMLAAGRRKALRARAAFQVATSALVLTAALCLIQVGLGASNASVVWGMFAAVALALACLTASKLYESRARQRLLLGDGVFMAIAAGLFLVSDIKIGTALTWGAVAVVIAPIFQLITYWLDARDRQGRGLPPPPQSKSSWRANT